MTANGGSTKYRNAPDVAMVATNIYVLWNNGAGKKIQEGTSASSPLWAGFMALANEQAAKQGLGPVGFANPALYAIGRNPAIYAKDFHDIQEGNNSSKTNKISFNAVPGYDLVTGWGSPQANLISDLNPPNQGQRYTLIEFDIKTGGDDLRDDSSATAMLENGNGNQLQTITLKAEGAPKWDNNTRHVVTVPLIEPMQESDISFVVVKLISHDGISETDDNWNINRLEVRIANASQSVCLVELSGDPLVRLTGDHASQSFTPRSGCQP